MKGNGRPPHRILFVETNEDGTVGGSHKALFDLVTHLDRSRFEPVVLFYRRNRFSDRLAEAGVETGDMEGIRARERAAFLSRKRVGRGLTALGAVRTRVRVLRHYQAHLVHIINSPRVSSDDWLPASKVLRIPCVASEMLMASLAAPGPLRKRLIGLFDRILPVSGFQEQVIRAMGVPPERITRIYHGIDAEALRAQAIRPPAEVRRELGVGEGQTLVAMVGNIREWKGQHVLLQALGRIPTSVRNGVRVVFAGSTTESDLAYRNQLDDLVRKHQLESCVSFLGFRDDAPDLLKSADVMVHASVEPEPGGVVVLEAMALGTAVIASDIGGQAEVITPECGLLFPTGDAAGLARQLDALVGDPARRQCLGQAATERMEEFSMGRNARETERVYAELLRLPER